MDLEFYKGNRPWREIRAVYTDDTVRVYQAFSKDIAEPALAHQTFVPPFRFRKITSWIKPSFLWVMARTNWGQYARIGANSQPEHPGNTLVLGIDIQRAFFDHVTSIGQITHFEDEPDRDRVQWRRMLRAAKVVVQWDPEKDLEGNHRPFKAIQIGLKADILHEYADAIVRIENMSPLINKIQTASIPIEKIHLLPPEQPYEVSVDIIQNLNMDTRKRRDTKWPLQKRLSKLIF